MTSTSRNYGRHGQDTVSPKANVIVLSISISRSTCWPAERLGLLGCLHMGTQFARPIGPKACETLHKGAPGGGWASLGKRGRDGWLDKRVRGRPERRSAQFADLAYQRGTALCQPRALSSGQGRPSIGSPAASGLRAPRALRLGSCFGGLRRRLLSLARGKNRFISQLAVGTVAVEPRRVMFPA